MYLEIKVKPRSGQSCLFQDEQGNWKALLKSAPVQGKANAELVGLISRQFGCDKRDVDIKTGSSGRTKLVHLKQS